MNTPPTIAEALKAAGATQEKPTVETRNALTSALLSMVDQWERCGYASFQSATPGAGWANWITSAPRAMAIKHDFITACKKHVNIDKGLGGFVCEMLEPHRRETLNRLMNLNPAVLTPRGLAVEKLFNEWIDKADEVRLHKVANEAFNDYAMQSAVNPVGDEFKERPLPFDGIGFALKNMVERFAGNPAGVAGVLGDCSNSNATPAGKLFDQYVTLQKCLASPKTATPPAVSIHKENALAGALFDTMRYWHEVGQEYNNWSPTGDFLTSNKHNAPVRPLREMIYNEIKNGRVGYFKNAFVLFVEEMYKPQNSEMLAAALSYPKHLHEDGEKGAVSKYGFKPAVDKWLDLQFYGGATQGFDFYGGATHRFDDDICKQLKNSIIFLSDGLSNNAPPVAALLYLLQVWNAKKNKPKNKPTPQTTGDPEPVAMPAVTPPAVNYKTTRHAKGQAEPEQVDLMQLEPGDQTFYPDPFAAELFIKFLKFATVPEPEHLKALQEYLWHILQTKMLINQIPVPALTAEMIDEMREMIDEVEQRLDED